MRYGVAIAGWLAIASLGREADAQHRSRRHRRAEPHPDDAAIFRRCGQPLPEPGTAPDIDPWFVAGRAELLRRYPASRFRWPPTSPCFREQEERLRLDRARRAFINSRVVNTCWQNVIRVNPSVGAASVRITLSVDPSGAVTVARVTGSPDPRFDACLNTLSNTVVPSVGPGLQAEGELSVQLTTGG